MTKSTASRSYSFEQRSEFATAARAELARRKLSAFVRFAWPHLNTRPLDRNWHIDVVCDHTQRQLEEWAVASDGGPPQVCQDLMTNIPPRCLKSTLVSVCGTAWAMLRWPWIKIGCLSVNPRVSFRDALATRTLLQSEWFQATFAPDWQISEDQSSVGNFGTTAGGSRTARGIASNVVGEGFDWLLIDDPHDPRDSEDAIQKVITGWDEAIASRVSDARYSIRSCIMQRVRENDFADHVLAQGWGHLCLPMEFEPAHTVASPYGWIDSRSVAGEVLDPVRFPPDVLSKIKRERGSYAYAAQYQQRPAPLAGGVMKSHWFKRFTMADLPAQPDWTTISVDATFGSVTDTADNVGLLVACGVGPKRYCLSDASRKMSFLDTIASIRALIVTYPQVNKVLIEKSAAGGPITEVLRKEINEGTLRTVTIVETIPREIGSKMDRVVAELPQLEAGMAHLLEGAPWVDAFVGEHAMFPNAAHDDRVDAWSQLMIYYNPIKDNRQRWARLSKT